MRPFARRTHTAIVAVATAMAFLVASAVPSAAVENGVWDYTPACDGASEAPGAFADAGFAADCLKLYDISFGKNDGTFGEHDLLTRSQVSSLLTRAVNLAGVSLDDHRSFPDTDNMADAQVRDEIERLAGAGIIAGFPDGLFRPNDPLTVAQGTTLVVRAMQFIHTWKPDSIDVHDQGETSFNYDYADEVGFFNPGARDIVGATYASRPSDTTARGLLADMMATIVQVLIDHGLTNSRSPYMWFRDGQRHIGPDMVSGTSGTDIAPGTYRAPDTQYQCGWDRRSTDDFSSPGNNIIGSGFQDSGPEIVTITASDVGFESNSCMYWTSDLRALKSPSEPIPPGTWQVGVEVAPGTYTASPTTSQTNARRDCTWERLAGFDGTADDVVASGSSSTSPQTVTITPNDVGFKSSSGCTAWTQA